MFDLHWRASSEGEAAGRQAGLAPSGDHSAALGGSSGELAEGNAAGAAWVGPEEGRNGHQNPVTPAQQRAVGGPQSGGSGEDSSGGEGEGEGPGRVPSQAISAALATELSAPLSAVDMGASPGVPGSLSPLGEAGAPGAERSEGHAVHAEVEAADEERAALLPPGLPRIETKARASVDGGHVASPLGAGGPADDEARTAQLASLAEQVGGGWEFGVGWGAGCAADEQVGICMIGARWARHIRFCVPGQWRQREKWAHITRNPFALLCRRTSAAWSGRLTKPSRRRRLAGTARAAPAAAAPARRGAAVAAPAWRGRRRRPTRAARSCVTGGGRHGSG